jgi:hypothetical protein
VGYFDCEQTMASGSIGLLDRAEYRDPGKSAARVNTQFHTLHF